MFAVRATVILLSPHVLMLSVFATASEAQCFAGADRAGLAVSLPFKPVNVCAQDPALCKTLLADYPAKDSAIGYFVTPKQWEKHSKSQSGFASYFIALHRTDLNAGDIDRIQKELRASRGRVLSFPGVSSRDSVLPFGIVQESSDHVSYGGVIAMPDLTDPITGTATLLVSVHSVLAISERVVSLYSFAQVKRPELIEDFQRLADVWVACVRQANVKK